MTVGPSRCRTSDVTPTAEQDEKLEKAVSYRRLALTVHNRDQSAAYNVMAEELESDVRRHRGRVTK